MAAAAFRSILDECLSLSPSVALRPEPFGALAYHFGNRRLTFLKRPELVEVVRAFDGTRALRECLVVAGVPERQWPAYDRAVAALADADMVRIGATVMCHA